MMAENLGERLIREVEVSGIGEVSSTCVSAQSVRDVLNKNSDRYSVRWECRTASLRPRRRSAARRWIACWL